MAGPDSLQAVYSKRVICMVIFDERAAELERILSGSDYKTARAAVDSLRGRIEKASEKELPGLAGELRRLFDGLISNNPQLYEILRVDEKTLAEEIRFKMTGQRIVID